MTKEEIETIIIKNYRAEFENYNYALCQNPNYNANILFVGINPSSGEEIDGKIYEYQLNYERPNHQYFNRFVEVANYCDCRNDWAHIDLFFFRGKQKEFYEILKKDTGKNFLQEQLKKTIEDFQTKFKPKIIVVCNSLSRDILLDNSHDLLEDGALIKKESFVENICAYSWRNIPVLFSGMLSGQRALDLGSLERLKWHIKMILEGYEMKK